jgi:hypothetical protein
MVHAPFTGHNATDELVVSTGTSYLSPIGEEIHVPSASVETSDLARDATTLPHYLPLGSAGVLWSFLRRLPTSK